MFWRNKRKFDFSWVSSDSRHSQKITLNIHCEIKESAILWSATWNKLFSISPLSSISNEFGNKPDTYSAKEICRPKGSSIVDCYYCLYFINLTDFLTWNLYFKLLINSPKVHVLAYALKHSTIRLWARDFYHAHKSRANNLIVLV